MMLDCIDLTLSEDERDSGVPAKRQRRNTPTPDSDVIEVVEQPACIRVPAQASLQYAGEVIDDDLQVTAVTGKVATRDYAHPRPDCASHRFSKDAAGTHNQQHCTQCFCFICDVTAAQCKFWGTGSRTRDHCNAHGALPYWASLRKAARKSDGQALVAKEHASNDSALTASWESKKTPGRGIMSPIHLWQRANLIPGSTPPSPAAAAAAAKAAGEAAGAGAGGVPVATPPPGTPAPVVAVKSQPKPRSHQRPSLDTASSHLRQMPHPSTSGRDPMQLLCTLELPVKAAKGMTIEELSGRLLSTGFYKPNNKKPVEYGEVLWLENINTGRYCIQKRKERQDYLKFLPLAPPSGLPAEPSREHSWQVVVVQHNASSRPQALAVKVQLNCMLPDFLEAIKKQLEGSGGFSSSEELLLASYLESNDYWRWQRDVRIPLSDDLLSQEGHVLYAFRIPKALLPRTWYTEAFGSRLTRTTLVAVMHEKTLPPEPVQATDGDDAEALLLRNPDGSRPGKVVRFGVPQLLVIPSEHLKGGCSANEHVTKAVAAQLKLYCQSGRAPRHNSWPFTLSRFSQRESWHNASTEHRFATASEQVLRLSWDSPGMAFLYAHWGSEPLVPPAGFDLEAFKLPEVQDADGRACLAGMPDLLKAWGVYRSEMHMLGLLPQQVLSELKQVCAASAPPDAAEAISGSPHRPAAAAVLSLRKVNAGGASSSASSSSSSPAAALAEATALTFGAKKSVSADRLGVLRVEVYIYKSPGPNHRLVTLESDNWGEGGTGRNAWRSNYASCALKCVMNARLMQEQQGYELLREISELNSCGDKVRGITKLMDWLVTGERAPALQPPGLTVQLHPYQLQSLAFMQEAESGAGGWRRLLWRWLPPVAPAAAAAASRGNGSRSGAGSSSAAASSQQFGAAEEGQAGQGVWYSPVLDKMSLTVPPAPWGGFLAEEMGLGKTVEILGLVLSNPAADNVISGLQDAASGNILSRATLVVCAVSLVGQWCTEAAKKLNGSLKMYAYHGSGRIRDVQKLACKYDLVVTTYSTLASDYGKNGMGGKNGACPLHKIKWHRVVFDEGHTVKNLNAAHSKACIALAADRRWCVTGTPINNDITDLLGQFSALRMEPLAIKSYFDSRVKPAFTFHGYGVSLVPLLYTLRHTLVRHTKAQTISGVSVLALPAKTEEMVPVTLSAEERAAYMDVHTKAAGLWASLRHLPPAAINQRLLQIMALLLPLRRICSGGQLRPADLELPAELQVAVNVIEGSGHFATGGRAAGGNVSVAVAAAAAAAAFSVAEDLTISPPTNVECPICLDAFERPVMTLCRHWYCKECILGVLTGNNHCPLCRALVDKGQLRAPGKNKEPTPVVKCKRKRRRSGDDSDSDEEEEETPPPESDDDPDGEASGGGSSSASTVDCESKLQALVAELTAMRAADPSSKALVFSQYNSTLEWLKRRLPQEGFGFRTITGSMPLRQRAKAIEAFQGDPPTTVFLLSMRSGAVGINLTAASHVFLLEPCLNPALEEQAIGRAWRMGQTRPVVVKRFYVKGSVEERIMDVRKTRHGPAAAAGAATDGAGSSAAAAAAAATAAEEDDPRTGKVKKKVGASAMAGALKADRQVLKIAELDLLFRAPELEAAGAGAAALDAGPGSSAAAAAAAAAGM